MAAVGPAGRTPTLYFKHLLLPHVPLRFLSGRVGSRDRGEPIRAMADSYHERWLVDQTYQRHLLQLEFTDRLLGSSSGDCGGPVGPLAA